MKLCKACSTIKPKKAFSRVARNSDGLHNKCRDCYCAYMASWVLINPEKYRENRDNTYRNGGQRKRIEANRAWLRTYLSDKVCASCGEASREALDFDHVHGEKLRTVSCLVNCGAALEKIVQEVAKCQVLCVKCHRIKTQKNREWRSKKQVAAGYTQNKPNGKQQWVRDYLEKTPCAYCGESDVRVLEFDHVVGEKTMQVPAMAYKNYSMRKIQEEVAKCQVLCIVCHRKKTALERNWVLREGSQQEFA